MWCFADYGIIFSAENTKFRAENLQFCGNLGANNNFSTHVYSAKVYFGKRQKYRTSALVILNRT